MLASSTPVAARNVFRLAATWHRHGLNEILRQQNVATRRLFFFSSWAGRRGMQDWGQGNGRFRSCGVPYHSRGLVASRQASASAANPAPLRGEHDAEETTRRTNESDEKKDIPPDWWIEALERTANAPWLFHLPNGLEDRLKRAFTLIFQIMIYLGRPQEEEKALLFLNAFTTAIVPPESEIGRARLAVANITRAIVHDISSVPLTSPIRGEHSELFGVFDALRPLHDVYLENMRGGEVDAREWNEFWTRAEPVLITLGGVLDQKGFGLEEDEREATNMRGAGESRGEKEKNREK